MAHSDKYQRGSSSIYHLLDWQSVETAEERTVTLFSSTYAYGVFMALLTAGMWLWMPILIKVALVQVTPVAVGWIRFTVAFAILLLVLLLRGATPGKIILAAHPLSVVAGIMLAVNYYFYFVGVGLSGAGNAQVFIQSGAVFLVLIGIVVFKERLTIRQVAGFLVAFLGFYLFFQAKRSVEADLVPYARGSALIVLSGAAWSIYAALQKHFSKTVSTWHFLLTIFFIGTVFFCLVMEWSDLSKIDPPYLLLTMFLGVLTLLAYATLAEALRTIPAAQIGAIISINPLGTLVVLSLLSVAEVTWVEPEPLPSIGYIGAVAVVIGVVLVVYRRSAKLVPEAAEPVR